jgi:hypothetical protein
MLTTNTRQLYSGLTGKIVYQINPAIKINADVGYRNQRGPNIDLNMLTLRAEIRATYRQLYFTFGGDIYKRLYLNERLSFRGIYIQIKRQF